MKFPKSRRILSRFEFARVRNQGDSICGKFMVMGYLQDETMTEPVRLGLITTKKIGHAVIRNQIRRKLRGILQRHGDSLSTGYYMVLIARKAAAEATSEQLEKEWKWMLHKTGMLKPRSTA
jgi:ribonuclease P protein component